MESILKFIKLKKWRRKSLDGYYYYIIKLQENIKFIHLISGNHESPYYYWLQQSE